MSDIFISYARQDRPKAKNLAGALETRGWSVWWDPKIPPGKTFDQVIEAALEKARCVVVLWSKESVVSEWVKTEAAEGKRRGILIPALLEDDVKIPLEFRRMQAARLADWKRKSSRHAEFESLVKAIMELLGDRSGGSRNKRKPKRPGSRKATKAVSSRVSRGGARKATAKGTWIDRETSLMWTIADNGKDINWRNAVRYAKDLRLGGFNDWRLPAIDELEKLYDRNRGEKYYNIREPFRLSSWWVWSKDKVEGSDSARYFRFADGKRDQNPMYSLNGRALCVRRSAE